MQRPTIAAKPSETPGRRSRSGVGGVFTMP